VPPIVLPGAVYAIGGAATGAVRDPEQAVPTASAAVSMLARIVFIV